MANKADNGWTKKDEFPSLPPQWGLCKLGDLAFCQSGGTPARNRPDYFGGDIHWVKTLDLNERLVEGTEERITKAGLDSIRGKLRPPGTVMVAMYGGAGTVGKSGLLGITAATNQAVCCIEPDPKLIDPWFLLNFMIYYRATWMKFAIGTRKDPNIGKGIIADLRLPTPPLDEQQAIAHVLRTVEQAREATEKVIVAARQLKQSLMRHLFTYGPVPVGQADKVPLKETEVGTIPEHWDVVSLEQVAEFLQYGTSSRCDETPKGNPVLRIPNVIRDVVDCGDLKYIELEERETAKYLLEKGDLLFVRTNGRKEYIGRCAVYDEMPEKALFASYLIRVRFQQGRILPTFMQMFCTTPAGRNFLSGRASSASDGKFNINTQILKGVMIPLPSLDDQEQIVEMVSSVVLHESSATKQANALDALFKSLLHHLMTGKVRVNDLDFPTITEGV